MQFAVGDFMPELHVVQQLCIITAVNNTASEVENINTTNSKSDMGIGQVMDTARWHILCIHCESEKNETLLVPITATILIDFHISFTSRLGTKFSTK